MMQHEKEREKKKIQRGQRERLSCQPEMKRLDNGRKTSRGMEETRKRQKGNETGKRGDKRK